MAVWRFLALGGIVGGVSAASFGPFITMGQLPQVSFFGVNGFWVLGG